MQTARKPGPQNWKSPPKGGRRIIWSIDQHGNAWTEDEVSHWKDRALRAEAEALTLRAKLAGIESEQRTGDRDE